MNNLDKGIEAIKKGDHKTAFSLFTNEAQNGSAEAQFYLGIYYRGGEADVIDLEESERLIRLAAEQGFALAQKEMGTMYFKGKYLPTDRQEAFKWFRLAAEQGNPDALYMLGTMYHEGIAVKKDIIASYKFYFLAGLKGDSRSTDIMLGMEKRITPEEIFEGRMQVQEFLLKGKKPSERGEFLIMRDGFKLQIK